GAVYMPALLIRPTPALPPLMPSTSHPALLSLVPLMVTENCCVAPVFTVADPGVTATLTVADEPPLLFNELPPPPPQLTSTTKHGSRRRPIREDEDGQRDMRRISERFLPPALATRAPALGVRRQSAF